MKGLRYYKTLLESYDGDRELALKKLFTSLSSMHNIR